MSLIQIQNLAIAFKEQYLFQNLNLTLESGKNTVLLGRSGVGKSSLLRAIAGFRTDERITGEITYPSHLRFAYLPQNYSLYPWLSVIDNVQLAAHLRHQKTYQTTQKAEQLLNSVGLDEHIHKKVFRLSGGQRQRVALARILMQDADVVLMDEPFSALDEVTKIQLLQLSQSLLINKTVLMITHSPSEALSFADQIYILRGGNNPLEPYLYKDNTTDSYNTLIQKLAK